MKKIISMMLVLMLVISLAACGNGKSEPQTTNSTNEINESETADSSVVKGNTESSDKTGRSEELTFDSDTDEWRLERVNQAITYLDTALGSDLKSYDKGEIETSYSFYPIYYNWNTANSTKPDQSLILDVSFDGLQVVNGTPVSTLVDAGFVLGSSDKEIEAGYVVTPFNCENKNLNRRLYLKLANTTDTTKEAKDCVITAIDFMEKCEGINYNGITKDDSLTKVIDAFGLPVNGFDISCQQGSNPKVVARYKAESGNDLEISFWYDPQNNNTYLFNLDFN